MTRSTINNRRRSRPTISSTKPPTFETSTIPSRRKYSRPTVENRRRITSTTVKPTKPAGYFFFFLITFFFNLYKNINSTASATEATKTTFPQFRRRYGYTSTTRRTTTDSPADINYYDDKLLSDSDQHLEPSIQDNKFTNTRFNQIGENLNDGVVEAITSISRAPLPILITSTAKYTNLNFHNASLDNGFNGFKDTGSKQITRKMDISTSKSYMQLTFTVPSSLNFSAQLNFAERTATRKPQIFTTSTTTIAAPLPARDFVHRRRPQPFQRRQRLDFDVEPTEPTQILTVNNKNKPAFDYDYYDDEDLRVVGKHNSKVKQKITYSSIYAI